MSENKSNFEETSVGNDSTTESKDEKPKNRRTSINVAVVRGVSGIVKWFSAYKGYGFITRDDEESDIFVHLSAIVHGGRFYTVPAEGDKVVFDVIEGFKGPEAWTVTGPDGKPVQGVRLLPSYNRSFNNNRSGTNNNRKNSSKKAGKRTLKSKVVEVETEIAPASK